MSDGKRPITFKIDRCFTFVDRLSFPNIYTALQTLATIPVTTCTCERSTGCTKKKNGVKLQSSIILR